MKEFWRRLIAHKLLAWELVGASFLISLLGLTSSMYSIQVLNRYLALGIDSTLLTITLGGLLALGLELVVRSARHDMAQWGCSRADKAFRMPLSPSVLAACMQPTIRFRQPSAARP